MTCPTRALDTFGTTDAVSGDEKEESDSSADEDDVPTDYWNSSEAVPAFSQRCVAMTGDTQEFLIAELGKIGAELRVSYSE